MCVIYHPGVGQLMTAAVSPRKPSGSNIYIYLHGFWTVIAGELADGALGNGRSYCSSIVWREFQGRSRRDYEAAAGGEQREIKKVLGMGPFSRHHS